MSRAVCPTCKNLVDTQAQVCPVCARPDPAGSKKRKDITRVLFGLCIMVGAGGYLYFVQLPQILNSLPH